MVAIKTLNFVLALMIIPALFKFPQNFKLFVYIETKKGVPQYKMWLDYNNLFVEKNSYMFEIYVKNLFEIAEN
jgi:hypothetical protein